MASYARVGAVTAPLRGRPPESLPAGGLFLLGQPTGPLTASPPRSSGRRLRPSGRQQREDCRLDVFRQVGRLDHLRKASGGVRGLVRGTTRHGRRPGLNGREGLHRGSLPWRCLTPRPRGSLRVAWPAAAPFRAACRLFRAHRSSWNFTPSTAMSSTNPSATSSRNHPSISAAAPGAVDQVIWS